MSQRSASGAPAPVSQPSRQPTAESSYDQESTSTSPTSTTNKSWLMRSVSTLMQLPRSTPLAALQWTDPEGPMPIILHLPSRDKGRTVEVYVWVPRVDSSDSPISAGPSNSTATKKVPSIQPSFKGVKRPCLVDFHGGGFIMGSPLEQAPWCSALARSGMISISVAYRLGPSHEFPAALHDAEYVVRTVLGGHDDELQYSQAAKMLQEAIDKSAGGPNKLSIDGSKVALSGFSSGGNVALNMIQDLSKTELDWPSPFPARYAAPLPTLLFFPSLDARQAPFERTRPAQMAPAGGLSKFIGRTMRNAYLPADKVGHLRASPGLAPTSALHPASRSLLILPEIDTLAEQSETWVRKLEEDRLIAKHDQPDDGTGSTIGRPLLVNKSDDSNDQRASIRVHRIKGMSHGFTTFPDSFIDEPTRKVKQVVMEQARRWVVSMLGGDPGDDVSSDKRVEALVDQGPQPGHSLNKPQAKLATAVE